MGIMDPNDQAKGSLVYFDSKKKYSNNSDGFLAKTSSLQKGLTSTVMTYGLRYLNSETTRAG